TSRGAPRSSVGRTDRRPAGPGTRAGARASRRPRRSAARAGDRERFPDDPARHDRARGRDLDAAHAVRGGPTRAVVARMIVVALEVAEPGAGRVDDQRQRLAEQRPELALPVEIEQT